MSRVKLAKRLKTMKMIVMTKGNWKKEKEKEKKNQIKKMNKKRKESLLDQDMFRAENYWRALIKLLTRALITVTHLTKLSLITGKQAFQLQKRHKLFPINL